MESFLIASILSVFIFNSRVYLAKMAAFYTYLLNSCAMGQSEHLAGGCGVAVYDYGNMRWHEMEFCSLWKVYSLSLRLYVENMDRDLPAKEINYK